MCERYLLFEVYEVCDILFYLSCPALVLERRKFDGTIPLFQKTASRWFV